MNQREYLSECLQKLYKRKIVIEQENYSGPSIIRNLKRTTLKCLSHPIKYFYSKLGKANLIAGPVRKFELFFGRELKVSLADGAGRALYFHGFWGLEPEYRLAQFFIKNFSESEIFYDVGANYGYYSLLAQHLVQNGEIHAFEPNTKIFPFLNETLSNHSVPTYINQLALSDQNEEITFFNFRSASELSTTKVSLAEEISDNNKFEFEKTTVTGRTLDRYTKKHEPPTLLKIDVEGSESEVIQGGKRTLTTQSPTVVMEMWKPSDKNNKHMKAAQQLLDWGYQPYRINEEGYLIKTNPLIFTKNTLAEASFENFVFKRDNQEALKGGGQSRG